MLIVTQTNALLGGLPRQSSVLPRNDDACLKCNPPPKQKPYLSIRCYNPQPNRLTMKHILIALLILAGFGLQAQQLSCCSMTATEEFANLTADNSFKASHLEPQPTTVEEGIGNMITYKTPDGNRANAFEILTPYGGNSWLFVFHEWWGLNDHMKNEAIKYFKELRDVNVLLIDLYDGNVATTRDEAGKLMQAVKDERAKAIIEGAIKHVGKRANIATVGWCFGGGWSLQATMLADKQATGAVMYYGMPEKDKEKLSEELKADVLFMFAEQDEWINAEVLADFEQKWPICHKSFMWRNTTHHTHLPTQVTPGITKHLPTMRSVNH